MEYAVSFCFCVFIVKSDETKMLTDGSNKHGALFSHTLLQLTIL